jgi:lysine 2,3-aminomutase
MNIDQDTFLKTPANLAGVFFQNDPEKAWKDSMRTAIKTQKALEEYLGHPVSKTNYPLFIPLLLAKEIKQKGSNSALWKQFIPDENENNPQGMIDPIGDQIHNPTSQLIHRYSNRVLFMPTTVCPVMCRYCFRKNELQENLDLFSADFEKTLNYLKAHNEINELIFSGGDPLILTNEKIDFYLNEFSKITHLKYIRFHTRTPVILPERITSNLIEVFNRYKKSFSRFIINIHINHTEELLPNVIEAIESLNEANIELMSQTVLLKNVNDNLLELKNLFETLTDLNIRPYYLHHPDPVKGGEHFRLTLEEGRKLYGQLRKSLSGWSIPQYVIDIPEGFGKVPAFNPENISFSGSLLSKDLKSITYQN